MPSPGASWSGCRKRRILRPRQSTGNTAANPPRKTAFSPAIRGSNPPVFLYGLVADYDAPMDEERRNKALAKMRIRPTHISESYSHGTHAVWLFERPIPLVDANSTHELLSIAYKELRLGSAFGPLDETALFTTAQYFHRGWRWRETGGKPIPLERLMLWQAKAWKKAAWCSLGQEIPLSRVAEEVERRFLDMGYDRAFPPGTTPETTIAALRELLHMEGETA